MLMLALCRTLGIIVVTNFVASYLVGNTLLDSTYATCPSFCCAMFVAVAILLLPQLAIECGSLMALLFGTTLLLTYIANLLCYCTRALAVQEGVMMHGTLNLKPV